MIRLTRETGGAINVDVILSISPISINNPVDCEMSRIITPIRMTTAFFLTLPVPFLAM